MLCRQLNKACVVRRLSEKSVVASQIELCKQMAVPTFRRNIMTKNVGSPSRPLANAWSNLRFMSSSDLPPHEVVKLPALSPTMEQGTIVTWEKKVGDQLSEGDLLCEIETDKATMGFETPEEGYLAKILIQAGSKDIPIGKPLCIIVSDKDSISQFEHYEPSAGGDAPAPATEPVKATLPPTPAPAVKPTPQPAPVSKVVSTAPSVVSTVTAPGDTSRPFASPAAKKLAAERGINLSQITKGSGMDGMITSKDVENLPRAGVTAPPVVPSAPTPQSVVPSGKKYGGMPAMMSSDHTDADISGMRKTIAKRLQASKHEIPHYYLTVECQVDNLMKLRGELNTQYKEEGIKLSVNDFIIKATALASKQVPECNSAWMDTFIREHHTCDVSVAVDTGSGLITPIVTSAQSKGLAEISSDIKELAGKAKEGKLQPHEFMGGTITVSNLGMMGISHFTAIINPPQSCILAVGGPKKKVLPNQTGDGYKTVSTIDVTLSCDHRVVDGAVGAQWLKYFKKYLEHPTSMLL